MTGDHIPLVPNSLYLTSSSLILSWGNCSTHEICPGGNKNLIILPFHNFLSIFFSVKGIAFLAVIIKYQFLGPMLHHQNKETRKPFTTEWSNILDPL